jgi:hypothetical protein
MALRFGITPFVIILHQLLIVRPVHWVGCISEMPRQPLMRNAKCRWRTDNRKKNWLTKNWIHMPISPSIGRSPWASKQWRHHCHQGGCFEEESKAPQILWHGSWNFLKIARCLPIFPFQGQENEWLKQRNSSMSLRGWKFFSRDRNQILEESNEITFSQMSNRWFQIYYSSESLKLWNPNL